MEEELDFALFRISRLEKRLKSLELSAFMMPVCYVDLAQYPNFTKNFCCYRSKPALKILCFSENNASLTVKTADKQYNYTLAPAVMTVIPLKKGNNIVEFSSTSSGGQIILELTEVN